LSVRKREGARKRGLTFHPASGVFHAASVVRRVGSIRRVGDRIGNVVNEDGYVICSAHDYIYGRRGYAVHTVPFAGYVPEEYIHVLNALGEDS
jgi:hypothetical protein